jgi:hypothetical protein
MLADGQTLPAKKLQVLGRIVGDIEAPSTTVMFGAGPVGTIVKETIGLRSLTARQFSVTGVRCEGDGLTVERLHEGSSATPSFRIQQKIGAKGERQGKVIFNVRPDGGKDDCVIVLVSWCGTERAPE